MGASSLREGMVSAAAAALMVVLTIGNGSTSARVSQQLPTTSASTVAPAALPSPSATEVVQPGSSASATATPSSAPTVQLVPAPADMSSTFTIQVKSRQIGDIPRGAPEVVHALSVPSGKVINPDEPPGSDWKNTSVWVSGTPYPQLPAVGKTIVGGHSCHHHACPFSTIQQHSDGSFTVAPKDTILVTTPKGVLTYQVCGIGLSSKSSPKLVIPDCGDLVVATCHFESGDTSDYNVVIAATLIGGTASK